MVSKYNSFKIWKYFEIFELEEPEFDGFQHLYLIDTKFKKL